MVGLTLLLAGLPSAAAAQQPLAGMVTDRETLAPLAGVYVALVAGEGEEERVVAAALTDESGRFVLPAEAGGRYRLRAERVGLGTEVTEPFTFEAGLPPRRIALAERAVELEGMSVGMRARLCRLEAEDAEVVQRWWDEVRKALETTAFVEAAELAGLRFERYEREWGPKLESIRWERTLPPDSVPSRPFVALDAESLAEGGFVPGEEGARRFLAPDAAVLFSIPFLETHCLRVAEPEENDPQHGARNRRSRPGELTFVVEPTRRRPPDIRGDLVLDTLTGELRTFEFTYVNLPSDLPRSEAGGHLTFAYLTSGAWIVSDWWIRMPQLGVRSRQTLTEAPGRKLSVTGYLEVGGRVVEAEGRVVDAVRAAPSATLHGVVYDSLSGGPLGEARVSVVGSRLSAVADGEGRFTLNGVPAGRLGVTFHHRDLSELGLPSPVVAVEVEEGARDTLVLTTPGLAAVVGLLCSGAPTGPGSILTGRVRQVGREVPLPGAEVRASWVEEDARDAGARSRYVEGRTGWDGRYVLCGVAAGVDVRLSVRTDSPTWRDAGSVLVAGGRVVVRDIRPGAEARAVVRGTVRSADGGEPVPGAEVWLLDVASDTVASGSTDSTGGFRMETRGGVGYRVIARAEGHLRESSNAFTLVGGESLEVEFDLARSPVDLAMELEGLLVEVGSVATVAQRLLAPYGHTPESLDERWVDREVIDAPGNLSGSIGTILMKQSIPGIEFGAPGLCLGFARGRTGAGYGRCGLVILDGAVIPVETAKLIEPQTLEAIAVLTPVEATTFFGTVGGGGALLLWTRQGGR